MAKKGDVLVNAWTTTDYMINPCRTSERFTHHIGIVRTLRRNGDASTYDSFQGQYDFDCPQAKRGVPPMNVYIVPREKFGAMTDDEIAAALGGRNFANLDKIRAAVRACSSEVAGVSA